MHGLGYMKDHPFSTRFISVQLGFLVNRIRLFDFLLESNDCLQEQFSKLFFYWLGCIEGVFLYYDIF
jgi:hypothetical protein